MNEYNLGIGEIMEQAYHDVIQKADNVVLAAFRSLGYTRDWIFENQNRLGKEEILATRGKHLIYTLDGKPLFCVEYTLDYFHDGKIYRLDTHVGVRFV